MMAGFSKAHGAGNDFIIFAGPDGEHHWPGLARRLCVRRTSVGADGLLLISPAGPARYEANCYNPDGSKASMCGNGLRCAARYVADERGDQEMTLVMGGDEHQVVVRGAAISVAATAGTVVKEIVITRWEADVYEFSAVNTGTEHVVAFGERLDVIDVERAGKCVRYHPALMPAGANVDFAEIVDRHTISVRTYERGVEAETLSCGSGAVAAVAVARAMGHVEPDEVTVGNAAGVPLVVGRIGEPGPGKVWLTGPAEIVYTGVLA